MPIIRSSRVLCRWLLPVVFGALVFKLSVWCGAEGCVSSFRAASILFPHINDDAGQNHINYKLLFLPHKSFPAVILKKNEIKVGKFVPVHFVNGRRGVER